MVSNPPIMKFQRAVALSMSVLPIIANAQISDDVIPGQVVVKYRGSAVSTFAKMMSRGITVSAVPEINLETLAIQPGQTVSQAIETLKRDPNVFYAEPVYRRYLSYTPNDPGVPQQYGLTQVQAPQAWDLARGEGSPIIAVIDTGFRVTHEEFVGRIAGGYNFANNNTDLSDGNGHGTHTAGLAMAGTNNAKGVASLAFNARLLACKLGNVLTTANSTRAITYSANNGARVISMSYGGPSQSLAEQDAVNYAWSKGVVIFAAAGNANNTAKSYPAAHNNVISVGATNSSGAKASFSTYGTWVQIAAPGQSMLSTYLSADNSYASMSGTSMACPFAASLAGLMLSRNPNLTNVQVRDIMRSSCDPLPDTGALAKWAVYGRINAFKALQQIPMPTPFVGTAQTSVIGIVDRITEGVNVSKATSTGAAVLVNRVDNTNFLVGTVLRTNIGQAATVDTVVKLPTTLSSMQNLYFGLNGRSGGTCTVTISLFNNTKKTWDVLGTGTLPATTGTTNTNINFPITLSTFGQYLSTTGLVQVRVRALRPLTGGTSSFQLTLDRINFEGLQKAAP